MIIRNKNNPFILLFAWKGTILPSVLPALISIVAISSLLNQLSYYKIIQLPEIPTVSFTIFGLIISIFMVFKNTACYDRWWEGRKLWGALIANARHIARDTHVLSPLHRERLLHQVIVFTHLLRDRLRYQTAHPDQFLTYGRLNSLSITVINININPPQYILESIQKDLVRALNESEISDIIYTSINRHIMELGNIQAGCDRIASTPLPFAYSVLLHRTLYCFCFILPFNLEGTLGVWTPFLVGLIAYMLLGLDALSSQLEEPFGKDDNDLPLDSIVRLIERELLSSLNEPIPPALQVQDYKLL